MSRRKRLREHELSPSSTQDSVTHEIRYVGCETRDLGLSIHGIRVPGEYRFTVFLPHGKVRHIEERGDRDALLNDKYVLHFDRQGARKEFVDKVGLAVEEHQIDDAPALSLALDNVNKETFRANKELSDQLQQIANKLEHMNAVLSSAKYRRKNGVCDDDDDDDADASGTSVPRRRRSNNNSTPRTRGGGSKK
jgi:hypothetical protein